MLFEARWEAHVSLFSSHRSSLISAKGEPLVGSGRVGCPDLRRVPGVGCPEPFASFESRSRPSTGALAIDSRFRGDARPRLRYTKRRRGLAVAARRLGETERRYGARRGRAGWAPLLDRIWIDVDRPVPGGDVEVVYGRSTRPPFVEGRDPKAIPRCPPYCVRRVALRDASRDTVTARQLEPRMFEATAEVASPATGRRPSIRHPIDPRMR
jgi:hypothetical protein